MGKKRGRKKKLGRPTKATYERQVDILVALGDGATIGQAAAGAGISRETLYQWMRADSRYEYLCRDAQRDAKWAKSFNLLIRACQTGEPKPWEQQPRGQLARR